MCGRPIQPRRLTRWWPYLGATVYVLVPIAGKTVSSAVFEQGVFDEPVGLPLLLYSPPPSLEAEFPEKTTSASAGLP